MQFSRSYVRYYSVFNGNYQCLLSLLFSPLRTASMRYVSHADNSYATQILHVQGQMCTYVPLHPSPCVLPFVNGYPSEKSKCLLYHFSIASNWTNLLTWVSKNVYSSCPRSFIFSYSAVRLNLIITIWLLKEPASHPATFKYTSPCHIWVALFKMQI